MSSVFILEILFCSSSASWTQAVLRVVHQLFVEAVEFGLRVIFRYPLLSSLFGSACTVCSRWCFGAVTAGAPALERPRGEVQETHYDDLVSFHDVYW